MNEGWVAIIVALISAVASVAGGVFAFKAALRLKTSNGHTAGEIAEDALERLIRIETWFVEHLRDHENRGL